MPLTGGCGPGKSPAAAQIAYLPGQRAEPYALPGLGYLSWAGDGSIGRAGEFGLMLENLAAAAASTGGLASGCSCWPASPAAPPGCSTHGTPRGLPLRVVRLTVALPGTGRRRAGDVTSGRRDDPREAAATITAGEGAGLEDVAISNEGPTAGGGAAGDGVSSMAE